MGEGSRRKYTKAELEMAWENMQQYEADRLGQRKQQCEGPWSRASNCALLFYMVFVLLFYTTEEMMSKEQQAIINILFRLTHDLGEAFANASAALLDLADDATIAQLGIRREKPKEEPKE